MPAAELYVVFDINLEAAFALKRREDLGFIIFKVNTTDIFKFHGSLLVSELLVLWVLGSPVLHSIPVPKFSALLSIHQHILHGFAA